MRNIYDFVTASCNELGLSADTANVQRIVGTLRFAGFSHDLSEKDELLGKEIIASLQPSRSQFRKANVVVTNSNRAHPGTVTSANSDDRFMEIDAYIQRGTCPRCKTAMVPVKLGTKLPQSREFIPANYCKACKTTLWVK